MKARLYIAKQSYPNHRGERLQSYAIWLKRRWWRRREFCGYAFEFDRAWVAMQVAGATINGNQFR